MSDNADYQSEQEDSSDWVDASPVSDSDSGTHGLFSEHQFPEAGHAQWNRAARCGRRPENSPAAGLPGATLVLCLFRVPVPLLAGAFLLGQVVMLGMGRKAVRLPAVARVLAGWKQVGQMVERAGPFCLPTTCWT